MALAEGMELSRDGVVRWRAPELGGAERAPAPVAARAQPPAPVQAASPPSEPDKSGMLTAGQIEAWEAEAKAEGLQQGREEGLEKGLKDGFAEGFEKGLAEGRAEGAREQQQQVTALRALLDQLGAPLKGMNEDLHNELLTLAVAMAQQLVRREIQVDPGEVIPVITDALGLLPSQAREVVVHVHPQDALLIRELLSDTTDDADWRIAEDPLLSRGGCRVESQNSSVDASLESRLAGLMTTHLSGRRHDD